MERADQFAPGTRLGRRLSATPRSIWLNEVRARRIREGGGIVEAEQTLTFDGAHDVEANISTAEVLSALGRLPEAQRETALRPKQHASRRSIQPGSSYATVEKSQPHSARRGNDGLIGHERSQPTRGAPGA
jgi:hypothetical protein